MLKLPLQGKTCSFKEPNVKKYSCNEYHKHIYILHILDNILHIIHYNNKVSTTHIRPWYLHK